MAEEERLVAYFSGHVQNVGFRFTAMDIARTFAEITGYVRNLPDGRVEVVAEGSPERAAAFVAAVASAMDPYIRNVTQTHLAATGEFRRFTIAR